MKLIYSPHAELEFQYTVEPYTAARKAAIDVIRNWSTITDLVAFAESRHGYENRDGFFGITYASDLDDFDRANGISIPNDYVEANAGYGASAGETHQLPESEYLELLRQFLVLNNRPELATRVETLLTKDV
ncbi:hypothetical protein AB1L30_17535 [Bremerella sp. JC817]|uniref:hypothetical protein n=1 Tax=Bremerella sp. JC817 TaxID=3231756 RepID=UPI0034574C04